MILTSWRHIIHGSAKSTKKSKTYGDNSYKDICYFPVWYWQVEHKSSRVVLSMHMNTLCQPITGNHWFCLSCPNFQPKDSIFTWEVPIKPNKTQFPRKVFEGCGSLQWHEISVLLELSQVFGKRPNFWLRGPNKTKFSDKVLQLWSLPRLCLQIGFYWDLSSENWVFCQKVGTAQ